jgi:hypothetical protein
MKFDRRVRTESGRFSVVGDLAPFHDSHKRKSLAGAARLMELAREPQPVRPFGRGGACRATGFGVEESHRDPGAASPLTRTPELRRMRPT